MAAITNTYIQSMYSHHIGYLNYHSDVINGLMRMFSN